MPKNTEKKLGLNAFTLKWIAVFAMVIDHACYAFMGDSPVLMTCVGRIAFPIFAFQVVEGFFNTSDVLIYMVRLFIFALISELPFDLLISGDVFFPNHQNVMYTLLIGLITIAVINEAEKKEWRIALPTTIITILIARGTATFARVDYSSAGILTILVFYFFGKSKNSKILQFVCLFYINAFLMSSEAISIKIFGWQIQWSIQAFAIFALIPIWLYNGKRGHSTRVSQFCGYAFYPFHLFVLYTIRYFL